MKRSNAQSLTPEQERTALVGTYLYKFAAIDRNRPMDEELVTIFVEALDDIPLRRLEDGLKDYLREGKGFPWPSQIRELSEL